MSIHQLPMLCLYKGEDNTRGSVNFEKILHLELVNSNKDEALISANKHVYEFDEKRLHDAAALEVMQSVEKDNVNAAGERILTKKKRKEMTGEEKSKQSRDRNREHARNTRLRKKVYVSKLKDFVENLSEQKRSEIKQCTELGARIHDMHTIRKEKVRLFLNYRANNVQDRSLWSSILDDEMAFTFIQPYSMYRHFHNNPAYVKQSASNSRSGNVSSNSSVGSASSGGSGSNSRSTAGKPMNLSSGLHVRGSLAPFRRNSGQVCVEGIEGMMVDCASLKIMIEGIGEGSRAWTDALFQGRTCSMRYEVDQEGGMVASGETVYCKFFMYTDGIVKAGTVESGPVNCGGLVIPGTLDCKFSNDNKIVSVEMAYDVASLIKQYEFMSSICPSMTRHILTSLDAIHMNSTKPHVVLCKVPLGAALVVHVNNAYWLSIGVDPASSIAQKDNWRGVSVIDFLTILQHPYNLYKDKPKDDSASADTVDVFDDESFFHNPQVFLPSVLHSQVVQNIEAAFVQGRASTSSYCSLSSKSDEMVLNYIKFFPIMHNTELMRNIHSGVKTTYSGQAVSHVLLELNRYSLYDQNARDAKSTVFAQYQQYQLEQQQQFRQSRGIPYGNQQLSQQGIPNQQGASYVSSQTPRSAMVANSTHTAMPQVSDGVLRLLEGKKLSSDSIEESLPKKMNIPLPQAVQGHEDSRRNVIQSDWSAYEQQARDISNAPASFNTEEQDCQMDVVSSNDYKDQSPTGQSVWNA